MFHFTYYRIDCKYELLFKDFPALRASDYCAKNATAFAKKTS